MPATGKPEPGKDWAFEDFKATMRDVAGREHPLPAVPRGRIVRKSPKR